MQPVFWGTGSFIPPFGPLLPHLPCDVGFWGLFYKGCRNTRHAPYKLKECVKMQEGTPLDSSFLLLLGYLKQQLKVMPIYYLTTLKREVGHRSHRAKSQCPQGCVLTQEKSPLPYSFRLSAESSSLWSQLPASLMAVSQGCTRPSGPLFLVFAYRFFLNFRPKTLGISLTSARSFFFFLFSSFLIFLLPLPFFSLFPFFFYFPFSSPSLHPSFLPPSSLSLSSCNEIQLTHNTV